MHVSRQLSRRAACLALAGAALALPAGAASLAERRAIKAYQENVFPAQLKAIHDAAGFAVPVDVRWEAIAVADRGDSYGEEWFWTKVYFTPLRTALAAITADAMGKDALTAKLKTIVVTFDEATAPASAYERGVSFAGGVLTVNFKPGTNADDVQARADAIRKVLEAGL